MKALILIGYMCVGKTTVGRDVAKRTGRMFYDLDWYIEDRFRKRVSQIFADEGEMHFRDMERRMLHEVAEFHNVVLACGGGTPCHFDNINYMNEVGRTIYLRATPETILAHLALAKGKRPLLEGKSSEELEVYVRQQLQEREPFYLQAQHVVDVDILDDFDKVSQVTDLIMETEK